MNRRKKRREKFRRMLLVVCLFILILCSIYIVRWNTSLRRIQSDSRRYSALYASYTTTAPTAVPQQAEAAAPSPTGIPVENVPAEDLVILQAIPTPVIAERYAPQPTPEFNTGPTAEATDEPTVEPTVEPT
ncbi:MAG: hypothetical protein U0L09_09900, partial [Christensenellales bacterium]|nr:hypothetical protein [Christensenellales bacterium]